MFKSSHAAVAHLFQSMFRVLHRYTDRAAFTVALSLGLENPGITIFVVDGNFKLNQGHLKLVVKLIFIIFLK